MSPVSPPLLITTLTGCQLCPPNIVCTPLFPEPSTLPGPTRRRRLADHDAITRLACRMCSDGGLQCPSNRPICDAGTCVQCAESTDCPDVAPYCDDQGNCRPCADGTSSCLVREVQTTCQDDLQCAGTNTPICYDDSDPATPNACVECLIDDDCGGLPAAYCRSDHVCVACLQDNDCGPPNPFCSPITNRCVTCLSDSDCSSPLPFCSQREGECT